MLELTDFDLRKFNTTVVEVYVNIFVRVSIAKTYMQLRAPPRKDILTRVSCSPRISRSTLLTNESISQVFLPRSAQRAMEKASVQASTLQRQVPRASYHSCS